MVERGFDKLFEVFDQLNSASPSKQYSPKQSPKEGENSTYAGSI